MASRRTKLQNIRGKSRSLSPKLGTRHKLRTTSRTTRNKTLTDRRYLRALRALKRGKSLTAAAKTARIPRKRLRLYVTKNRLAHREGNRWIVHQHRRRSRRRMLTFSGGKRHLVVLSRKMASLNGRYLNSVKQLLHRNDPIALAEFAGQSIKDIYGHEFPLESHANTLYRTNSVPEPFHEIYQVLA